MTHKLGICKTCKKTRLINGFNQCGACTIKNKLKREVPRQVTSDIIHMKYERILNEQHDIFYLCNWVVKPSKNKLTKDWRKVTCKNCLRQEGIK